MTKSNKIYNSRFHFDFDKVLNGWFYMLLTTEKIEAYLRLRYHFQSEAMENIIKEIS